MGEFEPAQKSHAFGDSVPYKVTNNVEQPNPPAKEATNNADNDEAEKRKRSLKAISELRPIDDVFFGKLVEDIGVCEELLQVILEDPYLRVEQIIPQDSIGNLRGREYV